MYCPKCGKMIPDESSFCLSCGAQVKTASSFSDPPRSSAPSVLSKSRKEPINLLCIIGLVFSCISILCYAIVVVGGLMGLIGATLSIVGLTSSIQSRERGKILAVIGIILGAATFFYGGIVLLKLALL